MTFYSEDRHAADCSLTRSIPASLALVGTLVFCLASAASAQSHTTTSSSSGHTSTSTSVHSTTFQSSAGQSSSSAARTSSGASRSNATVHRARGYWRGGVYYPYVATGGSTTDANNAGGNNEAECQGGPTIFDRCSSNPGYIPPMNEGPAHAQTQQQGYARRADSSADSANPTTLVFKDGHEVEVDNYAVAGHTLYDLTPGSSQKIALSDLDLSATQKQNHDHGSSSSCRPARTPTSVVRGKEYH